MLLKEIMTKEVITVTPQTPLREVGKILKEKKISGMPVVDANNDLVGIITVTDILKILKEIYQWQQIERKTTGLKISDLVEKESLNKRVKDVMTKNVITVNIEDGLKKIHEEIAKLKFRHLPVVKDGYIIGMISNRDLVYLRELTTNTKSYPKT